MKLTRKMFSQAAIITDHSVEVIDLPSSHDFPAFSCMTHGLTGGKPL